MRFRLRNNRCGGDRELATWLARAAACVAAGGLLSGCSTPWTRGQCDTCVPPNEHALHYHHSWDTLTTVETADHCALKDLKHAGCGKTSHHFKGGFVRAYEDLALGRYAAVPPVPPSRYWAAYYRSCAGQLAVEDWYAGYRTGLEIGMQTGVSRFNRVRGPGQGYCGPIAPGIPGDVPYHDDAPPAGDMIMGGRDATPSGAVFPAQFSEQPGFSSPRGAGGQ